MVPKAGLEPAQRVLSPLPPQGSVSTYSTTSANTMKRGQAVATNCDRALVVHEQQDK